MAAETLSLIERWLRAGDAGEFDVFDECLHNDVVVHAPLGLSTNGREAEKDVWRNVLASIPDLHHDVQEVIKDGSTIAARVVVRGTLVRELAGIPATGRPFGIDQVVFAHLRDGKAEEIWEIADIGRLGLGDSPTVP